MAASDRHQGGAGEREGATPLLSVVLPAYNVAAFVGEAIRSVAAQTHSRIELLVVDDGSTDTTPAVVREALAAFEGPGRTGRLIEQANGGASAARTTALEAASGDFVGFIDADDSWDAPLAAALIGALRADAALDLVFPRVRYVDEGGAPTGPVSTRPNGRYGYADLLVDNPIHTATGVIVRAEAAAAVGGFDPALRSCTDLDYWVRIGQLRPGNIGGLDRVLASYRKRPGQITSAWERMERGWRAVMAKARAEDPNLVDRIAPRAEASRRVFWSSIAYEAGDYAAARRLIAQAWAAAPLSLWRREDALVRLAACAVTLAPAPLHRAAARAFGAVRHGGRAGPGASA